MSHLRLGSKIFVGQRMEAFELMRYQEFLWLLRVLVLLVSTIHGDVALAETQHEHLLVVHLANISETKLTSTFVVKSEGRRAQGYLSDASHTTISVAIVLDAGPSQAKVLAAEKELAVSVVRGLSDRQPNFVIGKAGLEGKLFPVTLDSTAAVQTIRAISGETGKRTDVPIYDLLGAAIREMSVGPGIRVLIFIGGGKDLGSKLRYEQLRSSAEANHVACFVSLSADSSHRGPRSILRHGWWMRELADDTAGLFLENLKTAKATGKVLDNIHALRLLAFPMEYDKPGRHKIKAKSQPPSQMRVQKAVFIEATTVQSPHTS